MVDKEAVKKWVIWDIENDYPWTHMIFDDGFMNALGDDEKDIIDFIYQADMETLTSMYAITDLMCLKFPSQNMLEAEKFIYDKVENHKE